MPLRNRRLRTAAALLAALCPRSVRRVVLTRGLGYEIHSHAEVGRSFIDVDTLVLAEGARIGHLNIIRGCDTVRMGRKSTIMALNWINAVRSGHPDFVGSRRPALLMDEASLITTLHFVDASDSVSLDRWSRLAGFGSIVQTHSVGLDDARQTSAPVRIGHHSLVATRSLLLPGACVPSESVVAGGAVVASELDGRAAMYAGVPAVRKQDVDPDRFFFTRELDEPA